MDHSLTPPTRPRVSVLIAVFNAAETLDEALWSVRSQTLRALEVVIVDDGSTDASRTICECHAAADSRVRVIALDHNGGMATARNRGWEAAQGEYVAILDADDVALPERLARQSAYLDAHPTVAVIGSAVIPFSQAGRRGSVIAYPTRPRRVHAALRRGNCIAHPAAMLRRTIRDEVGGYRFARSDDYDLWLRISERHGIANLPDPLTLYRVGGAQMSASVREVCEFAAVARAAARARRAGRPDPIGDGTQTSTELLERVGVHPGTLRREIQGALIARAVLLAEVGEEAQAASTVEEAARTLGHRARPAFDAACMLSDARRNRRRRPLAAFAQTLAALATDPRWTLSTVRSSLLDAVGL